MASHNIYFLLTLFCFFFAIQASPSPLTANTISISLITPNGHTEWKVGARETVTWKVKGSTTTKNPPEKSTNSIYLTTRTSAESDDMMYRLAQNGFDISSGEVKVEVPSDVRPGRYYITLVASGYSASATSADFSIAK